MRKGVEVLNTSQNNIEKVPDILWDMPHRLIDRYDKDPMPVFRLETNEETSMGRKNNYLNGRPVESMIRTPIIPNVVDMSVGNRYMTIGLPMGSSTYVERIESMKFRNEQEAYSYLADCGFAYVVDLGRVTRVVDMGGPSLLFRSNKR